MTKVISLLLIGLVVGFALATLLIPAQAHPAPLPTSVSVTATPAATRTRIPTFTPAPRRILTATPTPTRQPTAAPMTAAGGKLFGWPGEVQCHNCAPFGATVRLTHYDPQLGDINCWDWSEEFSYCMSPTILGVPWESVWGIAAACPIEWPLGTWVDIPEVGNFICLDRGDAVTCNPESQVCAVDLLGPGGAAWDGLQTSVTLWVPLKPRAK